MLLSKELNLINDINNCNANTTCKINYDNFNKTQCIINNSTITCECLMKPLQDQCEFNDNLPNILYDMFRYIMFMSIINTLTIYTILGFYLGHYRTKISHKYNILYNSRNNFLIHCIPCTNQCALCQEYNTINMIDNVIKPNSPVIDKF